MAHEQSTTFKNKRGKVVNVKTVFGGKKLPESVLRGFINSGHLMPLGGKEYNSFQEAEVAAKKRSSAFVPPKGSLPKKPRRKK